LFHTKSIPTISHQQRASSRVCYFKHVKLFFISYTTFVSETFLYFLYFSPLTWLEALMTSRVRDVSLHVEGSIFLSCQKL
jgi:hypothetical protein